MINFHTLFYIADTDLKKKNESNNKFSQKLITQIIITETTTFQQIVKFHTLCVSIY